MPIAPGQEVAGWSGAEPLQNTPPWSFWRQRQRDELKEWSGPVLPVSTTTTTVNLLASQCPAVQVPIETYMLAAASVGNGNAPNAPPMLAEVSFRQNAVNPNFLRLDLTGRVGAGVYALASGVDKITLSTPTNGGLGLTISAGKAMGDGLICIDSDHTLILPDNTSRVWIWLVQGTTPSFTYTTTTTAPSGNPILCGSAVTSGGAITNLDTSGVMYLRGGIGYRQTADDGAPTDAPSSQVMFYTQTAFCTYLWDGTAHRQMYTPQVGSDPATPQDGDMWYRTDTMSLMVRAGGVTITGPSGSM